MSKLYRSAKRPFILAAAPPFSRIFPGPVATRMTASALVGNTRPADLSKDYAIWELDAAENCRKGRDFCERRVAQPHFAPTNGNNRSRAASSSGLPYSHGSKASANSIFL